jgi:maltose-binding protein MalE
MKEGGSMKRIFLKRLLLLVAMAAMVLVLAVPAIAGGTKTGNSPNSVDQDVEQDAESGEVDQSFTVTSDGDNSNQCAGIQGVANTGNAQNVIDLTQVDGEADDFEFDEVDSSIEVSPESSTTCDQQVNQAASASG